MSVYSAVGIVLSIEISIDAEQDFGRKGCTIFLNQTNVQQGEPWFPPLSLEAEVRNQRRMNVEFWNPYS